MSVPVSQFWGFPGGSVIKTPPANAGAAADSASIRGSGRRPWHPTPVLLPGKSHGRRSLVGCSPWGRSELDTTERLHFHALEKEMATHSSVLAWRIPGMGEPGRLPSMGSHRVRHDWSDLAATANAGAAADSGSIPGSGRLPGRGNGNPLQYSCLEHPMDRGAWWATKSQTWLSRHLSTHMYSLPIYPSPQLMVTTW